VNADEDEIGLETRPKTKRTLARAYSIGSA